MSVGGLIAQATLGATREVGQGIGDRIREEAKLKRQQALEGTRTMETMKRQTHNSGLRRDENKQQHGMTLEQQDAQNQNARGRIKLTDELGQENYADVTDKSGNLIGQRERGSNQYTPYSTKSDSDLSDREKLRIETMNSEIEAIYKGAKDMGGALTPDAQSRINTLTLQRNQMLYGGGGGGTILSNLLNGEGGDGKPGGSSKPEPDATPDSLRGLVGGAMNGQKQETESAGAQGKIKALEDEADKILAKVKPTFRSGRSGMPAGNTRPEMSEEDIAVAQSLVQRLIALDENPETSAALSDRQRNNLAQRIMELQEAGVPISLN